MHQIRKPKLAEVAGIKALLDAAAARGDVLARPILELYETARDFFVYVDEQGVGGCCALHIDMLDLAEIRSLVVREDLRGRNIGARLIQACLDEAQEYDVARIFTLTRIPDYFKKLGFADIEKRELPHKVYMDCARCPQFPDCDEVSLVYVLREGAPSLLDRFQGKEIS